MNFEAIAIHGDKHQRARDNALRSFKHGYKNILVATDVAARGLDVDNIALVLNYDLPKNIDDYVHRIGRTGRAGKKGESLSFYDPFEDQGLVRDLVETLKESKQEVAPFLYDEFQKSREFARSKRYGKTGAFGGNRGFGGGRSGGFGGGRSGFGDRGGFGGGRGDRGGFGDRGDQGGSRYGYGSGYGSGNPYSGGSSSNGGYGGYDGYKK